MLWAGSSEPKLIQKVINNLLAAPTPLSDGVNALEMTKFPGTARKSNLPAGHEKAAVPGLQETVP